MQGTVAFCSGPGSARKKRNVLLSDVLVTSCVAVYTKYRQSDQGACWCVPLSGTFRFAMEQCLKSKSDSVLEAFSF